MPGTLVTPTRGPNALPAGGPRPSETGAPRGARAAEGKDRIWGRLEGNLAGAERAARAAARGIQHSRQSFWLFGPGSPGSQVGEGERCVRSPSPRLPPGAHSRRFCHLPEGAGSAGAARAARGRRPRVPPRRLPCRPPAPVPGAQGSRPPRLTQSRHESVEEETDDGHGEGHVGDGGAQGALLLADLHHHPAGRGRPPVRRRRRSHRRRRCRRLGVFVRRLHGGARSPGAGLPRPGLPPRAQEAGGGRLRAPGSGLRAPRRAQASSVLGVPRGSPRTPHSRVPKRPALCRALRCAPTPPAEGRGGRRDTR